MKRLNITTGLISLGKSTVSKNRIIDNSGTEEQLREKLDSMFKNKK